MKQLKTLIAAAAVALVAATSAQAAVEENTYFVSPTFDDGSLTQYFSFDNSGDAAVAGDTFIDTFLFNSPPPSSMIDFVAHIDLSKLPMPGLAFSGYSLFAPADGTTYSFSETVVSPLVVAGNGLSLDSGVYALQLTGTYLQSGGAYQGAIEATMPVPEPETWALALAGLAFVGTVARRRLS